MEKLQLRVHGTAHEFQVEPEGAHVRVNFKNRTYEAQVQRQESACPPADTAQAAALLVFVEGEPFYVRVEKKSEGKYQVFLTDENLSVIQEDVLLKGKTREHKAGLEANLYEVLAPMPGKVVTVKVSPGDRVQTRQVLLTLEAMKMENEILSPSNGVVKEVRVKPGDSQSAGDCLVIVEES